jgi:hypothetical protein
VKTICDEMPEFSRSYHFIETAASFSGNSTTISSRLFTLFLLALSSITKVRSNENPYYDHVPGSFYIHIEQLRHLQKEASRGIPV